MPADFVFTKTGQSRTHSKEQLDIKATLLPFFALRKYYPKNEITHYCLDPVSSVTTSAQFAACCAAGSRSSSFASLAEPEHCIQKLRLEGRNETALQDMLNRKKRQSNHCAGKTFETLHPALQSSEKSTRSSVPICISA